ncbi:MAG: rhomboid family intramembrane serine protease [Rhodanobacteraceae bacterium]
MNAPLVTVWLVIVNLVVYAAQLFLGDRVLLHLALWPPGEHLIGMIGQRRLIAGFEPLQLLSYGFLHGDAIHLLFNLVGIVVFGPLIERCMGIRAFGFYYLLCLVVAGGAQIVLGLGGDAPVPTIGASGAVYGLLAAAASLYPQRRLTVLPGLSVAVRTLAWLLGGSALFHGVFGTSAGVAHFAHLGGMVGGWLLIQYWRGRLPLKPQRWLEP